MKKMLVSWIGKHDLNAENTGDLGPVFAAIDDKRKRGTPFDTVHLLCNYSLLEINLYLDWLDNKLDSKTLVSSHHAALTSPTAYDEIYPVALEQLTQLTQKYPDHQRFVHLSPGTPAMTAVWVLLVKTQFPSVCLESWIDAKGQHVQQRELPLRILASVNTYSG